MRFGGAEEGLADFFDQSEDRLTIRVAREHPVESQQVFGERIRFQFQHAYQCRRQRIKLIGLDHHAGEHLLRAFGVRFDVQPQAGHRDCLIQVAGLRGNFDGAFKRLGVAGAQREIGIGFDGQFDLTALKGNLGQQDLISRLLVQFGARDGERSRLSQRAQGRTGLPERLLARVFRVRSQSRQGQGDCQDGQTEEAWQRSHGFLARRVGSQPLGVVCVIMV